MTKQELIDQVRRMYALGIDRVTIRGHTFINEDFTGFDFSEITIYKCAFYECKFDRIKYSDGTFFLHCMFIDGEIHGIGFNNLLREDKCHFITSQPTMLRNPPARAFFDAPREPIPRVVRSPSPEDELMVTQEDDSFEFIASDPDSDVDFTATPKK
jgi:hypothetical protein